MSLRVCLRLGMQQIFWSTCFKDYAMNYQEKDTSDAGLVLAGPDYITATNGNFSRKYKYKLLHVPRNVYRALLLLPAMIRSICEKCELKNGGLEQDTYCIEDFQGPPVMLNLSHHHTSFVGLKIATV